MRRSDCLRSRLVRSAARLVAFAALCLSVLAPLAGGPGAARAGESDPRRNFLLGKKAYCASAYTVASRFRTDSYCVAFYRELVVKGIDGEAYAFYCDLKAEELYGLYTDPMCDKAEALLEMDRLERQLARNETGLVESN